MIFLASVFWRYWVFSYPHLLKVCFFLSPNTAAKLHDTNDFPIAGVGPVIEIIMPLFFWWVYIDKCMYRSRGFQSPYHQGCYKPTTMLLIDFFGVANIVRKD